LLTVLIVVGCGRSADPQGSKGSAGVEKVQTAAQQPDVVKSTGQAIPSEVTAVLAEYGTMFKKSPPPEELKQCIIGEANKFHMEAATIHVKNGSATVSVVTKEPDLPDDVSCMFVALEEHAKLAGVGDLISKLGVDGLIGGLAFPGAFIQGLILPNTEKSKGRLTVFEGQLAQAGKDVNTTTMPFNGHIALQLCQKTPEPPRADIGKYGPAKPASNVLWVKVQVDE
jgi:hypothetical protein